MIQLSERIRAYLRHIPRQSLPITYHALAQAMELSPPNTIRQVTSALETLMEEDVAVGQAMIASFVISRSGHGLPAAGFFEYAKALGRYQGEAKEQAAHDFHASEMEAALSFWVR